MLVKDIKEQRGTLKKLQNLLEDGSRKIHGVFYSNDFFSQRYLARSQMVVNDIDIKDNKVKLKIIMRLESAGLQEIEYTLSMLMRYEAGDLPGFSLEEPVTDDGSAVTVNQPFVPESISADTSLFSTDLFLILDNPELTFQEFTIAGSKFTLVNLKHILKDEEDTEDEGFEQEVSILFGEADRLYLFSHFYNKELNARDTKLIFDLIVDENITGKAITGVKIDSPSGSTSAIFPKGEMISSYESAAGEYIFGTAAGYVRIVKDKLKDYKLSCIPQGKGGGYCLELVSSRDIIRIYME